MVYASLAQQPETAPAAPVCGVRSSRKGDNAVDDKVSLLVQPISRRGFLQGALTGAAIAGSGLGLAGLVPPASAVIGGSHVILLGEAKRTSMLSLNPCTFLRQPVSRPAAAADGCAPEAGALRGRTVPGYGCCPCRHWPYGS